MTLLETRLCLDVINFLAVEAEIEHEAISAARHYLRREKGLLEDRQARMQNHNSRKQGAHA